MVRNYIRKTDRVEYPPGHIVTAVREILLQNQTVTSVSVKFSIPRRSLLRYLKKAKEMDVSKLEFDFSLGGYKKLEGFYTVVIGYLIYLLKIASLLKKFVKKEE